ncbi:MAG: hypothetical protein FWF51_12115 [Chitinivibrionia bacterium]|nr:hypothetical protein [Chitinivibrionia bacterium]
MEIVNVCVAVVSALATFGMVLIARCQLPKITKQLTQGQLMTVLEIESQMNERKQELSKMSKIKMESKEEGKDVLPSLYLYIDATVENYLNSIDRLCFCIDKKYLDGKDWKTEYRDMIFNTVETHKEKYDITSPYINTIKKVQS